MSRQTLGETILTDSQLQGSEQHKQSAEQFELLCADTRKLLITDIRWLGFRHFCHFIDQMLLQQPHAKLMGVIANDERYQALLLDGEQAQMEQK